MSSANAMCMSNSTLPLTHHNVVVIGNGPFLKYFLRQKVLYQQNEQSLI